MPASRGRRRANDAEEDDAPVPSTPARSSQPNNASNVRRTAAPPPSRPHQARPAPRAASASQETGDGGAEGEGSAQNNDDAADNSQNTEVDCSQQDTGRCSRNPGGLDISSIPVSRRSGDNAKSMLASTAVATFEYDKTGVGFIWT